MIPTTSLEELYTRLETDREPFLRRARDAVRLSIPGLLREEGHDSANDFVTPWQSVGARAVNNLGSKLLLTLFPPSSPFFRLRLDESHDEIVNGTEQIKTEIESKLVEFERRIMFDVETSNFRVKNFEVFQHLVACGNALTHLPEEGGQRCFHLDQYVVERDPVGNVVAIVIEEEISPMVLDPRVQEILAAKGKLPGSGDSRTEQSEQKTVRLYTGILRNDDNTFTSYQEVCGEVIPDTEEEYPENELPYLALRLYQVDGESYGRGLVEQYIGDLRSLEGLSAAIVEAASASARVLVMVRPNGTTKRRDVAKAANGAVIQGNPDDVGFLQAEKQADLRVAGEVAQRIEQRLSLAFLLNTAVQRQAERVTAEEIRYMAQELEDSLGGVYSVLSQEMQLPMVRLLIKKMVAQGRMPSLPDNMIKAVAVTGLEGLGRGHELQRLQVAFDIITRTYGPEALISSTNPIEGMERIFNAVGIDADGLLKSEQQIAQERQQAQMAEVGTKVAPEVVKGAMSQVPQAGQ